MQCGEVGGGRWWGDTQTLLSLSASSHVRGTGLAQPCSTTRRVGRDNDEQKQEGCHEMFGNNCMTTITIHRVTQHRIDVPRTRAHASTTWAIKKGKERKGGEKIDADTPLLTYYHCLRPPMDGDVQQSTARHVTRDETTENKAKRGDMKHFGDHCTTTITIHRVTPRHKQRQHTHACTRLHRQTQHGGDDGKKNGK